MSTKTGKLPPVPPPKPASLAVHHSVETAMPLSSAPPDGNMPKPGIASVSVAPRSFPSISKIIGVNAIPSSEQSSEVKMVKGEWVKKIGNYIYYSDKPLGEGGEARVYKVYNLADASDYVSILIILLSS